MAVDTRQRRFSMLDFGTITLDAMFEADGTVDDDDRMHLLDLYSGLAAAADVPVPGIQRRVLRSQFRM